MFKKLKQAFDSPAWTHILTGLGVIAIIDWVVFPSLTAASTIFNVFGLIAAIGTAVFVYHYVKDTWFTKSEQEQQLEKEWKEDLEKKVDDLKKKNK